jgi:hypothetical protein
MENLLILVVILSLDRYNKYGTFRVAGHAPASCAFGCDGRDGRELRNVDINDGTGYHQPDDFVLLAVRIQFDNRSLLKSSLFLEIFTEGAASNTFCPLRSVCL